MTKKELKDYFKRLVKVHIKEKSTDVNELIDSALISGLNDFWGAVPWAFKEKHTTISASSETVDLPDDFEGLISVVEKDSAVGSKLQKYSADEYDRLVPDSAGQNTGTPSAYKIYCDEGIWKLALSPTPSAAITLYLTYQTIENGGAIPDKYIGGLIAGIAQYLFMPGSPQWNGAFTAFTAQIEKLKKADNPDIESISRVLDSGDGAIEWSLEEWMRTGQVGV